MTGTQHYLDHAAGTPPFEEATIIASQLIREFPGNPSGLHRKARQAAALVEEARERLASVCGAPVSGVVFTSGGTEADNLAIKGIAFSKQEEGLDHVVVSSIEHHAVLDSASWLKRHGFQVDLAPVRADGVVDLERLEALLKETTGLVSVMTANNETGAVQPIREIATLVRERSPRAVVHSDACQAFNSEDVTLEALGVDALTLSAHKIGGIQGAGALVSKKGVKYERISHGGGQELGRRAGTHNVAAIVAFGVAAEKVVEHRPQFVQRTSASRDALESRIVEFHPTARINSKSAPRLPHITNVTLPGFLAEDLLVLLDRSGICASAGSACTSGTARPSHVLLAMGAGVDSARSSIRFSFGHTSSEADVDAAADALREALYTLGEKHRESATWGSTKAVTPAG